MRLQIDRTAGAASVKGCLGVRSMAQAAAVVTEPITVSANVSASSPFRYPAS